MPEGKVCRFMDPLKNRHERTVLWKYGLCCSLNSIQLITWGVERDTIIPNYFVRMFVHCIIRVVCLALLLKKLCPLLSTAWEYVSLRRVSRSTITLLYQKNCFLRYCGFKILMSQIPHVSFNAASLTNHSNLFLEQRDHFVISNAFAGIMQHTSFKSTGGLWLAAGNQCRLSEHN